MLNINRICFSYPNGREIFRNFSMKLNRGELMSVMGESGCGKSTLLHLIAGLLKPDSGTVRKEFRKVSFVFQEARLFPWLTVEQNLSAVFPKDSNPSEIRDVLELVELEQCIKQYPAELSGGMKSRVSLARALISGGDLCLLDEPFSSLDEKMREKLLERVKIYLHQKQSTAIMVTHQKEDAEIFSNRILILNPEECLINKNDAF